MFVSKVLYFFFRHAIIKANFLIKNYYDSEENMRIRFENANSLLKGISYVASDLGFEIVDVNADLTVTANEVAERTLSVTLDGSYATITYGEGKARFFRGLAKLIGWIKDGVTEKTETENPLFEKNDAMFSESMVMRVETVKATMRGMALMGLNSYMLYTEDTYEVTEYPYFGHARGRFSKAEIKEIDAYALELGIELIPCIQVLGHLSTYLKQANAGIHKDTSSVLLVGSDETYKLIDAMFNTIEECFTTKRVHIGMDGTHDLGVGRYLDRNGYRERHEIFFEHLARVKQMAEARGFDLMMWSDMFFRLAGKGIPGYCEYDRRVQFTDEFLEGMPKGVRPVFWDYYNIDKDFYSINIIKHREAFDREPIFAGGVWLWSGIGPLYSRSFMYTYPALDACRETGLQEIVATVWGGDGTPLILAMPGLAWYADYDYIGGYDEESMKRCLRYACDIDYDTMMNCELIQHPDGSKLSLALALLYNDPLIGIADKHLEELPMKEYYAKVTAKLEAERPSHPLYAPAYEIMVKTSAVLEYKADFGVRLKRAYDAGDREALASFISESDVIIERLQALREADYNSWMTYHKPYGWEMHDVRYGGLVNRFETVKRRLADYLEGRIATIEELDEERLRLIGKEGDEPFPADYFLWKRYRTYASALDI